MRSEPHNAFAIKSVLQTDSANGKPPCDRMMTESNERETKKSEPHNAFATESEKSKKEKSK